MAATPTLSTGRRPTAAEAEHAWRAWRTYGEASARDFLVLSYLPLVRYLAARKARELPSHSDVDDLVSCGTLALVAAVDLFDPTKGSSFEQYAWARVSGAFVDELRRQDWAPRSVRRFAREAEQARARWFARHGTMPVGTELARELQIDPDELQRRLQDLDQAALVSLNAPIRDTNDGVLAEVGDTLEATDSESPEESALASERRRVLRQAIAALSPRERRLLRLLHVEHLTGAEAGRALGVSESRVSQILTAVRAKLRRRIDEYDALGSGPAIA